MGGLFFIYLNYEEVTSVSRKEKRKNYVLDTNVLLHDLVF